jgi:hypothetical protein
MSLSPTTEGFRAAVRRPSLALAEISWRWTVGATGVALFAFSLFEYLRTLPVTNGELLMLRTRHPYFVGEAIARILRGNMTRAMFAEILGALMLMFLWIVAASVGRMATVRGLLEYFRSGVFGSAVGGETTDKAPPSGTLRPLVRLNFLRAAVAVAAVFGFVGAGIVAGFASPTADPQPGLAFLLFLPLAALVCVAWSVLNWVLSLAQMFAVRNGEDAMGAIANAVTFCRERFGAIVAVSIWGGLAHLVALVAATTVAFMFLGFVAVVPRLAVAVMLLVAVIYFAVADWLYMARLAGYTCIAEVPEALLKPEPAKPVVPILRTALETTIDRDERILSDMPGLA